MNDRILAKGTINCGTLDWNRTGRKLNRVEIEWRLTQGQYGPCLAASGHVWNGSGTDIIEGGQMVDRIAERVADPRVQRLAEIWRAYHLNELTAGTPEQERAAAEYREGKLYPDTDYTHICEYLKTIGLYEVPADGLQALGGLPDDVTNGTRGYRYGERWLYSPIPAEIVAELMQF